MHLLYIADPLCSWCYGFEPQLAMLLDRHPGARLDLVMGGLRPYTTEPMTAAFKDMLRGHWRHVHEASGLPFSEAILARDDFVYDTEPPSRAVVTARALDAPKALASLKAIQEAFYRDGRDVTRPDVLAALGADQGYDREAFLDAFASQAMREATREDFALSRSLGVTGFPTLALRKGDQLYLVAAGYANADVLAERIEEVTQRLQGQPHSGGA